VSGVGNSEEPLGERKEAWKKTVLLRTQDPGAKKSSTTVASTEGPSGKEIVENEGVIYKIRCSREERRTEPSQVAL